MKKSEKKLLEYFRALPAEAAQQLQDFAEFLAAKYTAEVETHADPVAIERPEQETVVAAVKRLSATYPMLNKDALLHETAGLVTQHIVQGREANEVIDELEVVFRKKYDSLKQQELKEDAR